MPTPLPLRCPQAFVVFMNFLSSSASQRNPQKIRLGVSVPDIPHILRVYIYIRNCKKNAGTALLVRRNKKNTSGRHLTKLLVDWCHSLEVPVPFNL